MAGQPWCSAIAASHRKLKGDIVNMELAADWQRRESARRSRSAADKHSAQVLEEITLPGYNKIVAEIEPACATDNMRLASRWPRPWRAVTSPVAASTSSPCGRMYCERTGPTDRQGAPRRGGRRGFGPRSAGRMFDVAVGCSDRGRPRMRRRFPLDIAVANC
jgi:hypothetical protein